MWLSLDQRALIRENYRLVSQMAEDYSERFYFKLLHQHPFARALFPDDLTNQSRAFRRTIDTLVEALDRLPALPVTLADLARRHVAYGVQAHHYPLVGDVLIETFAEMSGSGFTAETRAAWQMLYDDTAGIMIREAYPQA